MKRFLVPEVIQSSVMDCGPASLKALFGGFGLYLSYGRLREACQTDVDGTSIDTLETMAQALGLDAAQVVIPADLVLLPTSACLPAIVVMRLAGGATHFCASVHLRRAAASLGISCRSRRDTARSGRPCALQPKAAAQSKA
jgi:ABC-type bacteriocin/lantibiotic exporter with double-glycine peptidase domain